MSRRYLVVWKDEKPRMMAFRKALLNYASYMVGLIRDQETDKGERDELVRDIKKCLDTSSKIKNVSENGGCYELEIEDIELYVDALSYLCNDQVLYCKELLDELGPMSKYWS